MCVRNDFVVESNGRCFLCLQQNSSSPSHSNLSPESKHNIIYSLQSLSEFLGINMKSVFKWTENIPPDLLKRVEQAKLKVELCKDCGSMIENFTKLYLQLEKIQMGLTCSLETIKWKLQTSNERDGMMLFSELIDSTADLRRDVSEKLDILKALRNETIEKCSSKLRSHSPRVRILNMTRGKVNKEKVKLKNKKFSFMDSTRVPSTSNTTPSNSIIKTEPQLTNPASDDISERDSYSDDVGDNDSLDSFTGEDLADTMVVSVIGQSLNLNDEEYAGRCNLSVYTAQDDKRTKTGKKGANVVSKYFIEVIPTGLEKTTVPQCLFDKKTEKLSCPSCPSTFSQNKVYRTHYKAVHLGIRYKCIHDQCQKKFTQKAHCYKHHQTEHQGVRFRCRTCGKHFRWKYNLIKHISSESCHLRLASKMKATCHCPICGEGFTQKSNMNKHIRKFHHQHV